MFFACSLMSSRLLAVHMMTQFSFGTSWTVHPQRAHHNSRTCSNSTLAPQHARTLTSQSNYGQWWLFHTPTTRVICHCIWNIFFLSYKLVPDSKCRFAQELPEWNSWIEDVFFTHHVLNHCKLRSLICKFGTNSCPLSKIITFIWNFSILPIKVFKC